MALATDSLDLSPGMVGMRANACAEVVEGFAGSLMAHDEGGKRQRALERLVTPGEASYG